MPEKPPINIRAGFHHVHSGLTECGIAYYLEALGGWDEGFWAPCSKPLNHRGKCGYADNTAH